MNEQLIEELKDLRIYLKAIKATMYIDSIDKAIQALTSVKSESAEDKTNPYAKTPEEIAQWVIDNRYPKSEQEKVSDSEMYYYIVEAFKSLHPKEQERGVTITNVRKNEQLSAEEVLNADIILKASDKFEWYKSDEKQDATFKVGFLQGAKWMHDFANNSEAMKENAIDKDVLIKRNFIKLNHMGRSEYSLEIKKGLIIEVLEFLNEKQYNEKREIIIINRYHVRLVADLYEAGEEPQITYTDLEHIKTELQLVKLIEVLTNKEK